jgi:hypothetical protein
MSGKENEAGKGIPTNVGGLDSEYSAVVGYHTALVQSRFTIAGLYSAALALLLTVEFKAETSLNAKLGIAAIGFVLTLCLWILELRSRSLLSAVHKRGTQIERESWGLGGEKWYHGFFSLQVKKAPEGSEKEKNPNIPKEPPPADPVELSLFFRRKPFTFPPNIALWVTHSRGLDLLYLSGTLIWIILVVRRIIQY